jgi:Spy/CpxP family protein refolding chaperone
MRSVRIVLALVVVLFAAAAVMAQEKETKKPRLNPISLAMMRMERFHTAIESLDLSQEQKDKLKAIHEEFEPKRKEILGKVHEVLTEDQKKALEDAMKSAKDSGKKGMEFFRAVEGAVQLTDEQKEKVGKVAPDLVALHKEAMKKVREVLTADQIKTLEEKMAKGKKGPKKSEG